jgi:hypothetical protein
MIISVTYYSELCNAITFFKYHLVEDPITCMTSHYTLRVRDHTTWFWRCLGTAFGHFLFGLSHFLSWLRLLCEVTLTSDIPVCLNFVQTLYIESQINVWTSCRLYIESRINVWTLSHTGHKNLVFIYNIWKGLLDRVVLFRCQSLNYIS